MSKKSKKTTVESSKSAGPKFDLDSLDGSGSLRFASNAKVAAVKFKDGSKGINGFELGELDSSSFMFASIGASQFSSINVEMAATGAKGLFDNQSSDEDEDDEPMVRHISIREKGKCLDVILNDSENKSLREANLKSPKKKSSRDQNPEEYKALYKIVNRFISANPLLTTEEIMKKRFRNLSSKSGSRKVLSNVAAISLLRTYYSTIKEDKNVVQLLGVLAVLALWEEAAPRVQVIAPRLLVPIANWVFDNFLDGSKVRSGVVANRARQELEQAMYQHSIPLNIFGELRRLSLDLLMMKNVLDVPIDDLALLEQKHEAKIKGQKDLSGIATLFSDCKKIISVLQMLLWPQSNIHVHMSVCRMGDKKAFFAIKEHLNLASQDEEGNTLVHAAVEGQCLYIIDYLANASEILDHRNTAGMTALDCSCKQGNHRSAAILLTRGAEVGSLNGKSALDFAVENQHANVVAVLLAYGCSPSNNLVCRDAFNTLVRKPTALDLSDCKLRRLSSELTHFVGATSIDLSQNFLVALDSPWMVRLPLLKSIDVKGNPIIHVSPALKSYCSTSTCQRQIHIKPEKSMQNFNELMHVDATSRNTEQLHRPFIPRSLSMDAITYQTSEHSLAFPVMSALSEERTEIHPCVASYLGGSFALASKNHDQWKEWADGEMKIFVHIHEYVVGTPVLISYLCRMMMEIMEISRLISKGQEKEVVSSIRNNSLLTTSVAISDLMLSGSFTKGGFGQVMGSFCFDALIMALAAFIGELIEWCNLNQALSLQKKLLCRFCKDISIRYPSSAPFLNSIIAHGRNNSTNTSGSFRPFLISLGDLEPTDNVRTPDMKENFSRIVIPEELLTSDYINIQSIARRINFEQSRMFSSIPLTEWLKGRFGKRAKAPFYFKLIDSNKGLTNWVVRSILTSSRSGLRVRAIQRAIEIAQHCLSAGNLFGMCGIVCGIQSFPVHRLSATFKLVPQDSLACLSEMQGILNGERNCASYRQYKAQLQAPSIPLLFPEVRDLLYYEEQPNFVKSELHITKFTGIYSTIQTITALRGEMVIAGEGIAAVEDLVVQLLNNTAEIPMEHQDAMSLALEPRIDKELMEMIMRQEFQLFELTEIAIKQMNEDVLAVHTILMDRAKGGGVAHRAPLASISEQIDAVSKAVFRTTMKCGNVVRGKPLKKYDSKSSLTSSSSSLSDLSRSGTDLIRKKSGSQSSMSSDLRRGSNGQLYTENPLRKVEAKRSTDGKLSSSSVSFDSTVDSGESSLLSSNPSLCDTQPSDSIQASLKISASSFTEAAQATVTRVKSRENLGLFRKISND